MAELLELWEQGGFVMPWLVGATFVLWYAIGDRWWTLRADPVAGMDPQDLQRHRVLIQSIAATAPLLGLLGTVSGMIETFDALTTMSLYRGSGGIAGGISEALISTQMGLAVAIPGLLAGKLLDRRQAAREAELDALAAGGA